MKKILLLAGALFAINANAQMPTGSQAPDFTTTDIYGNTVDMSDILDSGKSVIMDVSATWCGPCWAFHSTHVLRDLYYSYGDGGSGEIAVIFVEGDANTTIEDLQGTGGSTLGDWVTDSPYIILDDSSVASSYQIAYYPTFYTICSDGVLTHFDQQATDPNIENILSQLGACNTLQGVNNHAKAISPSSEYYCSASEVVLEAGILNYGVNDISSASVELMENGSVIATSNFNGSIAMFEEGTVSFDDVTYNEGSQYSFKITSVNGNDPFNDSDDLILADIEGIVVAGNASSVDVQIEVKTDYWPSEISWDLRDSNDNVIFNIDSYDGPDQTGPDANATFTYDVTLPNVDDCYTVNYYDEYGDGWGSNPEAGITVRSSGEVIYSEQVGNFGSELNRSSAFSFGSLGVSEVVSESSFFVYPNPSNGIVNVKSKLVSDIEVLNAEGKLVFSQKDVQDNTSLDLSFLPKGVYFMVSSSEERVEKTRLIIK